MWAGGGGRLRHLEAGFQQHAAGKQCSLNLNLCTLDKQLALVRYGKQEGLAEPVTHAEYCSICLKVLTILHQVQLCDSLC